MYRIRRTCLFVTCATVILLLLGTVLVVVVYRMTYVPSYPLGKRALIHLSQLDGAIELYTRQFGQPPPLRWGDRMKEHVSSTLHDPERFYATLADRNLKLGELEADEALVLWLGEVSAGTGEPVVEPLLRRGTGSSEIFYFGQDLVDHDGDGWLEHAWCSGGKCIRFSLGHDGPIAINEETGRTLSYRKLVQEMEQ